MRYVVIFLALLLAAAGVKIYLLADEVSELELSIERQKKEAAIDHARKLEDQAAIHATVLIEERRRRLAAVQENEMLLNRIREVSDAKYRLAQSLRIAVNELFDRARHKFGHVPGDTGGPPSSGTATGEEPLNEDLARELSGAWAWCERGWQRVLDIAAVHGSCR